MKSGQEGKKWQETEGEAKKHGRWGGSWEGVSVSGCRPGTRNAVEHALQTQAAGHSPYHILHTFISLFSRLLFDH